jgi:hypothetical protein
VFYGMVIAQAQAIEIEGNSLVVTFAPAHKHLRAQLEGKRAWIESLAATTAGRRVPLVIRESAPAPAPAEDDAETAHQSELRARAQAEPAVQAVLDVFGGEIEDVEELE